MTIIDRVKSTGVPLDSCIVIGSGLLDALGLREAGDIDLVVSQELFDTLNGSEGYVYTQRYGLDVLDKDDQEIWLAWGIGDDNKGLEELSRDSVVIDGVRFVSPEFLLAWKRSMNRPKDARDIELLEEYLKNNAKIG